MLPEGNDAHVCTKLVGFDSDQGREASLEEAYHLQLSFVAVGAEQLLREGDLAAEVRVVALGTSKHVGCRDLLLV